MHTNLHKHTYISGLAIHFWVGQKVCLDFCKILLKNSNEFVGQPKSWYLSSYLFNQEHSLPGTILGYSSEKRQTGPSCTEISAQ